MNYAVTILPRALRDLKDIPRERQERVRQSMRALAQDPRPAGCKKLENSEGWRVRVGDYRIVYVIDDAAKVVTVVRVGHRRDVYR